MNSTNPLLGLGADKAFTVTASGNRFFYALFCQNDISFLDIATHLAQTCRWLGALRRHYSTAEHSVMMAEYALRCRTSQLPKSLQYDDSVVDPIVRREFALACLFHDAEEFVTGDFPSPLKQFFPLFEEYASYVRECIYEKYGISYEFYPLVRDWDRRILFTEAEKWLVGGTQVIREPGEGITPTLGVTLRGWTADHAVVEFHKTYLKLI